MKGQGKKLIVISALAFVALVFALLNPGRSYAYSNAPFSAAQTGTLNRPAGPIAYTRVQVGPRSSGSYLVWTERDQSASPEIDDLFDTHDIAGMSLTNTTAISVTTLPGNQTNPAISGSRVVWESDSPSCPSACDRDILGINLATGLTFTVASGSSDQAQPAIAGSTAVWVDLANQTEQLLAKDINSSSLGSTTVITTVSILAGYTLAEPLISSEYITWSEMGPAVGNTSQITIKAYNRSTGAIQTVTQSTLPRLTAALADHRLVWTDGWQLYIADLSTQNQSVLFASYAATPAIDGAMVVWSSSTYNGTYVSDIWGLQLTSTTSISAADKPVLLVSAAGDQLAPTLTGDTLAWQSDGGPSDGRVSSTSLSAALAAPPSTPPP